MIKLNTLGIFLHSGSVLTNRRCSIMRLDIYLLTRCLPVLRRQKKFENVLICPIVQLGKLIHFQGYYHGYYLSALYQIRCLRRFKNNFKMYLTVCEIGLFIGVMSNQFANAVLGSVFSSLRYTVLLASLNPFQRFRDISKFINLNYLLILSTF